jgi:hypothetical protein
MQLTEPVSAPDRHHPGPVRHYFCKNRQNFPGKWSLSYGKNTKTNPNLDRALI